MAGSPNFLRSVMIFPLLITLVTQPLICAAANATNSTNSTKNPDGGTVSLTTLVGIGLLPTDMEEGLVSSAGPRFTNALYATATNTSLGSCWSCIAIVAQEIPCIAEAVETGNLLLLLDCGVTTNEICNCVGCLPEVLSTFLQEEFCDNSVYEGISPTLSEANATYSNTYDWITQGFLGIIDSADISYLEEENKLRCAIGASCGNCCCVGLCVLGNCIGGCF